MFDAKLFEEIFIDNENILPKGNSRYRCKNGILNDILKTTYLFTKLRRFLELKLFKVLSFFEIEEEIFNNFLSSKISQMIFYSKI